MPTPRRLNRTDPLCLLHRLALSRDTRFANLGNERRGQRRNRPLPFLPDEHTLFQSIEEHVRGLVKSRSTEWNARVNILRELNARTLHDQNQEVVRLEEARAAIAAYRPAYRLLDTAGTIDMDRASYLEISEATTQGDGQVERVRALLTERDGNPPHAISLAVQAAEEVRDKLAVILSERGWRDLDAQEHRTGKYVMTEECCRRVRDVITHLAREFGLPQPPEVPEATREE